MHGMENIVVACNGQGMKLIGMHELTFNLQITCHVAWHIRIPSIQGTASLIITAVCRNFAGIWQLQTLPQWHLEELRQPTGFTSSARQLMAVAVL